ncbi:alpha/beta fold hydrolase [Streptomyces sp. NPDC001549]|uniref:alpha/beta fold hydrolase n=1 Tax=Streptomyces sp. NPDC001549 TaxID=3364586 RepID=UPI0036877506
MILIHGFNNSEQAAAQSYQDFRVMLRSALSLRNEESLGIFWEFHWPGDHPTSKLTSALTYTARIGDSERSGERLAELLDHLGPTQEVTLIAHSLGCRVALESVHWVNGPRYCHGARIRDVFLLAAAVPASQCEPGRPFQGSYFDPEHIFWSRKDKTLRRYFKAGGVLYHANERDDAVGRCGRPTIRWNTATRTDLDHGEYWKSYTVAKRIGWIMGERSRRLIPDRSYVSNGQTMSALKISDRSIPERILPERRGV